MLRWTMNSDRGDREPIVNEGAHAVVEATDDESADYWLVSDWGGEFPLRQENFEDAVTALFGYTRSARTSRMYPRR
jgi:hypothetical protein